MGVMREGTVHYLYMSMPVVLRSPITTGQYGNRQIHKPAQVSPCELPAPLCGSVWMPILPRDLRESLEAEVAGRPPSEV